MITSDQEATAEDIEAVGGSKQTFGETLPKTIVYRGIYPV